MDDQYVVRSLRLAVRTALPTLVFLAAYAASSRWRDDFEWLTVNAMKSAFAPFPERLRIINGIIKPRYALLRAELSLGAR